MNDSLSTLIRRVTDFLGQPVVILVCLLLTVLWIWRWGWQAFDNGSQLICFVLLFMLLHCQNRDSKAAALKANETIRAIETADDCYRGIETAPEAILRELAARELKAT